jgi:transcriptional regulator with PAS, ATPase and Fis domain
MRSIYDFECIDLKTLYLLLTGNEVFSDFSRSTINSVFIANEQGDTLWVTSGCEQLWGYTAHELHGKNVVDLERKGYGNLPGLEKFWNLADVSNSCKKQRWGGIFVLLEILSLTVSASSKGL